MFRSCMKAEWHYVGYVLVYAQSLVQQNPNICDRL